MTRYPNSSCVSHKNVKTSEPVCLICFDKEVEDAKAESIRLWNLIDRACNALTDSICVSGNDFETNLHWVKKLRKEAGEKP